ncbi:unnamed protein product, partial [Brachionus calyciflorus]
SVQSAPFWDACLSSPCNPGQICDPKPNFGYVCINEFIVKTSFKVPINFQNTFDHNELMDPCFSSPCQFGTVCKKIPNDNFICLKELEISPEAAEARQIYKDMELRYSKAIGENIENIAHGNRNENLLVLKGKKELKKSPCESNPCEIGYTCQLDDTSEDGFVCVEQVADMTVQRENMVNKEYLSDKNFVRNITFECGKRQLIDRIPNPKNPNQFIVCLDDADFTIMDCPDGLVFNQYLDRCDYTAEATNSGCESSPCQYGAKCVQSEDNNDYKCECPEGFSGKNCEKSPDFCASNPCGSQGVCHSLPYDSPIPYYCTCFDNQAFGVNCDEDSEKNPCLNDETELEVFKTDLDDSIYVHCNNHKMHLKYCHKPLVFSQEHQACEWVDLKQRRVIDNN